MTEIREEPFMKSEMLRQSGGVGGGDGHRKPCCLGIRPLWIPPALKPSLRTVEKLANCQGQHKALPSPAIHSCPVKSAATHP